ncbi:MAG TPA: MarR family transcriptional regulator [Xanthomonadales bacterium]|nr:MarR family transcriptional regulator [Xanthomonadales bacterium]
MNRRRSNPIDLGILPELIGYHLHRAEIASYREFIKAFHTPKYTPKQFSVLILARANPGTSQIAIGKALGMDRATTMTVIDKLQAEKLLTREQSKGDRRKQEIKLTEKGISVTDRLVQHAQDHEAILKANLSDREAATLSKLLVKVRNALES